MSGIYRDPRRYDLIYRSFKEDVAFYRSVAASTEGALCDLACGTGRVTLPLAEAFPERRVYGVDSEAAQLRRGRRLAGDRAIKNVYWIQGSMAEVTPPERCGYAFCALHSLEHLTEEDELERFFEHLRERVLTLGGLFAFALHLPDPSYLVRDPEELRLLGRYGEGDYAFSLYEKSSHDPSRQLLSLSWFFEPEGEGEMEAVRYTLRLFYPREIRRILREHGFELLGHWGWYDRSPLAPTSATQVLLAHS
jgi:SAM-dependent methyltransferase